MTRPAASSRILLLEHRGARPAEVAAAPIRRYRLARLRPAAPVAHPDTRWRRPERDHD